MGKFARSPDFFASLGFESQISDDSGGEIWIGSFESKSPKQGQIQDLRPEKRNFLIFWLEKIQDVVVPVVIYAVA